MRRKIYRYAAFALSASLITAAFTSCGDNAKYESSSSSQSYDGGKFQNALDESYSSDYIEHYDGATADDFSTANEEYKNFEESGYKDPKTEPLSTFSADVDTASYSNVRRLIENGNKVPEDAVRIEEFINYFDYNYPDPEKDETFSQYIEIADCPWNKNTKLMMLGIQGDRMRDTELPPSNLVFLIDSSGSMNSYDKLPLVQQAFGMLTENLREYDRISIVTYASKSDTLISGASAAEADEIYDTLYSITAGGSTNGEGGIETAYKLAEKYFIEGGNNRIILATDGDLNVGASSEEELTKLIEEKRDKGIYLSVLGFGTGNYKDARLEAVADNGNGNYSYIDSVEEAERVLVKEMSGTLFTIAKDVKLQVEFNPSTVKSYRLIGYDNRLMNAEDFYDNTKDAGEVGAGHSVTALYEVELAGGANTYHGVELEFADEHSQPFDEPETSGRTELCKLSVTYKDIDSGEDIYRSKLFGMEKYSEKPSDKIILAGAAAEFAMLLKNSEFKMNSSYDHILDSIGNIDHLDDKAEELTHLVSSVR